MQALRSLRRERASTLLALLCLSIAIGTNTTVFSIVNGLMFRDLPLTAPERLVLLQERADRDPASAAPVSYAVFQDLSAPISNVMDLAAERRVGLRISEGGSPERYAGSLASWNLFAVLGVHPAMGRAFLEGDDRPGAPPVVILSHLLWQQRYAADPAILGRAIVVGDTAHTVVGVMPRDLAHVGLRGVLGARLWVPFGSTQKPDSRNERQLRVYGRLRAGVTHAAAGSALESAARHLAERHTVDEGWGVSLEPLRLSFSASTQAMFVMLLGAVSMVLLIACANLANLTLARTSTRRHELATRLALGASRPRVVMQFVSESLIVALASVPPGILLAFSGRSLVLGPAGADIYEGTRIDVSVLLYTIALALLATVLAGLLPAAFGVRRLDVDVLRSGRIHAGGVRHAVVSRILVGAQASLAMILLVGALVFLKSFRTTMRADGGFDTSRILVLHLETVNELDDPGEPSVRRLFGIVDRAAAVPGVRQVAAANLVPLRDGGARTSIVIDAAAQPPTPPAILLGGVTAQFFDVLGVPVVRGRALTDAESRSTSPVAVINRRMAERLWPGESAVGRRFKPVARDVWFTVVGVAENILNWDLSDRPLPTAYVPYPHVADRDPRLLVRTAGDPAAAAPALRAAIYEASPSTPILNVSTMTDVHRMALGRHVTLARLFGVLGGIALLLGAVGVYGVLSYFVSQRTAEIGIRAALGADPRSLVTLFVKQGIVVAGIGLAAGVPAAWVVARVLRGRLYNVSPPDAPIFLVVSALLLAVALVAAYVPSRRAAAVDPLVALRQ
jgi:predicted permease